MLMECIRKMVDYMKDVRDYLYTPNSNPCEKDRDFYVEFAFICEALRNG